MKTVIWIIVAIVVIGGIWYLLAHKSSPVAQPSTASTTPAATATPILETNATSTFGTYLTGTNGHALYTYAKDSNGTTTCYGACAANWPPYTVSDASSLVAPSGVSGQLSTVTRTDGSMQVTYNGMPLYFFVQDTDANSTKGQGFMKVWSLVKP